MTLNTKERSERNSLTATFAVSAFCLLGGMGSLAINAGKYASKEPANMDVAPVGMAGGAAAAVLGACGVALAVRRRNGM